MDTPKLLYHYTGQSGLIGIISEKAMWASSNRYVNDASEYTYAEDMLKQERESIRGSISEQDNIDLDYEGDILRSGRENFVVSFTEVGDLLSQWRGYCPTGSGFSIGFDFALMKGYTDEHNVTLVKCVYDVQEQKRLIRELLYGTVKVCKLCRAANVAPLTMGQYVVNYYLKGSGEYDFSHIGAVPPTPGWFAIAPLLKHPSFSEEREWRAVTHPYRFRGAQHWKFREGKHALIPYVLFSIPDPSDQPIIGQIIVGPTPFPDLVRESVIDFTSIHGIKCEVVNSAIPFRG